MHYPLELLKKHCNIGVVSVASAKTAHRAPKVFDNKGEIKWLRRKLLRKKLLRKKLLRKNLKNSFFLQINCKKGSREKLRGLFYEPCSQDKLVLCLSKSERYHFEFTYNKVAFISPVLLKDRNGHVAIEEY